jgi:hypothetical protein
VNGIQNAKTTDSEGRFYQGLLGPGGYAITISKQGYKIQQLERVVFATLSNNVIPLPVQLEPEIAVAPSPTPTTSTTTVEARPSPTPTLTQPSNKEDFSIGINTTDGRRGGAFRDKEVSTLPLGGTTLVRTFDELALLLPGVALPPQTQGSIAGPGVGAGVGSAGQFSVNGLRSRANNFTVDGSDNNDEDIGVRRQGFLELVPQPVESIQEYQITTLLAPAQYGRNIGAQVNANSKSGGSDIHGVVYGFFNSSQLNARNTFDTNGGGSGLVDVRSGPNLNRRVTLDGSTLRVLRQGAGEDSFTLGQGGFAFGGPLEPERCASDISPCPDDAKRPGRMFYFFSGEGHILNATKEMSFAVPNIEQRGFRNSGATGITLNGPEGTPLDFFPTRVTGDAVFSLYPFPNNPNGIYRSNTYTQVLPASGQGKTLSGKFDGNFDIGAKPQTFTARYNFTDDWRDIPAAGGAIFSSLRPRVRTQNFSTFLTSQLSGPTSARQMFNYLRLSYGRTRLNFQEYRDPSLIASDTVTDNTPFLLNRPLILNNTLPGETEASYVAFGTTELGTFDLNECLTFGDFCLLNGIGPVGQVAIAGYSPVGVDVFNFPQRRVNNTYQLADTLSVRIGNHNFSFGADTRRTELNSDLPRNSRPLAVFGGTPQLPGSSFPALSPTDVAALGSPTNFFHTLARGSSTIHLRYYQWNFFGQDEWRVNRHLSVSYGLRYEYNTVPRETSNRIESTFKSPDLALLPDLSHFLAGRTKIYDADKNNFAPRFGVAYSRNYFGDKTTVIRGGYGLYYDQILGAVVSQSRNVFPTFLTLNTAGGSTNLINPIRDFVAFNPGLATNSGFCSALDINCYVVPGTINVLNAPFTDVVNFNRVARAAGGFGFTLPAKNIQSPMAHQYSVTVEQQLSRSLALSVAYVGTLGRKLLRFTTPNLGPNVLLSPSFFITQGLTGECRTPDFEFASELGVCGTALAPGNRATRPFPTLGAVYIFDSGSRSRYDSLQAQLRGRLSLLGASSQFQANYTFSSSKDDVSDVFDLAGAPSLPQDNTYKGEYAPSNFDARHRLAYNSITDLSRWGEKSALAHFLFNGLQVASTTIFQTGQPFTVNSIFDVNLDGNLTDRPNSLNGIQQTGDRSRPLRLTVDASALRAPIGQSGSVPRNAFRASNLWLSSASFIKNLKTFESQSLIVRVDIFNVFNRANYAIPVRLLEAPGFGQATDTVTPGRRIQFALKYSF